MDIMSLFEAFLNGNKISYQKKENTVSFSFENKNYVLLYDPQDPNYYRLTLPKVNDSQLSLDERNKILIKLTSEFKVAKTIDTINDGVWFSYEQLLMSENVSDCEYVFARSIRILSEMLNQYRVLIQSNTH